MSYEPDVFAFLGHHGPVASLIRGFAWSATSLGHPETWPQSLKTAVALIIHSPVPIVMLWGEDGVMIYNDAYSAFAGHRHPSLLGSNVREGWAEVADFNDHVMNVGLAGGTLAYRDQELTLHRNGYPEQVWMNLDYSPIPDEHGRPAGVVAVVVETTDRVMAEKRNQQEFERLQSLFVQAPTFMAMLSGADHKFVMVNPEYRRLVGGRDVVGMSVREALPEMGAQGFLSLLDHVSATGEAVTRTSERVLLRWSDSAQMEERFVDFVYQPIRGQKDKVEHIFVQGSDVTERVRAERHRQLLINELNHRLKNTLSSVQSIVRQTLRTTASNDDAAKMISSRILAISRAHNVLTAENWEKADLGTVIGSVLALFQDSDRNAVSMEGPALQIGPHAAMSIALAVHELAANATRYGALSAARGRVSVMWSLEACDAFVLSWSEQGGPPVHPAPEQGFGSRLLECILPRELQGSAVIDFHPNGVIFTLTSTHAAMREEPALDEMA